jgi:hypothetical protein
VVRSLSKDQWTTEKIAAPGQSGRMEDQLSWTPKVMSEASIQDAYLQMITRSERFIYVETQYFIGSGGKWGLDNNGKLVWEYVKNAQQSSAPSKDVVADLLVPDAPVTVPTGYEEAMKSEWCLMPSSLPGLIKAPLAKLLDVAE